MKKTSPARKVAAFFLFALFSFAVILPTVGCEDQDGPLEDIGEEIDDAVEEVGDNVEDATDG